MNNLPLNLLTFPLWWYTTGFNILWSWNKRQFSWGLRQTGIALFIHHIREPLYGDYTKSGIILGFFLRVVLLIFKLIFLLARLLVLAITDAAYLLSLPVILAVIIFQFMPQRP